MSLSGYLWHILHTRDFKSTTQNGQTIGNVMLLFWNNFIQRGLKKERNRLLSFALTFHTMSYIFFVSESWNRCHYLMMSFHAWDIIVFWQLSILWKREVIKRQRQTPSRWQISKIYILWTAVPLHLKC